MYEIQSETKYLGRFGAGNVTSNYEHRTVEEARIGAVPGEEGRIA